MKSHQQINEQKAYDMWLEGLNSSVKSAVCMVLYVVIKRKWHRDKVIKLFDDIVDMINTPIKVFGKEVDDLYIQDYISEKYPEIDFSRIKVNAASKDESRRRSKEHDRTQQSRKELKAKEPKLIIYITPKGDEKLDVDLDSKIIGYDDAMNGIVMAFLKVMKECTGRTDDDTARKIFDNALKNDLKREWNK